MKKILFLIITSLFIANQTTFAIVQTEKNEQGYISLNTIKEKDVDPNFAQVKLAVETTGLSAIIATEENNKITNKIISELKLITNQATDTIKTNNLNVRPVYTTKKDGTRVISNYTAQNSITITSNNIKNIPNIIDKAILNGANSVSGLNYSYKEDENVCKSMYPLVIKELKEQADLIAKSAGSELNGIKHINASCNSENSIQNGRLYAKATNADAAGAVAESYSSAPIEFGKVKVRVYLNADFYVK